MTGRKRKSTKKKSKSKKKLDEQKGPRKYIAVCVCSIIVLVLMYQIYLYSGVTFDQYLYPALNWTGLVPMTRPVPSIAPNYDYTAGYNLPEVSTQNKLKNDTLNITISNNNRESIPQLDAFVKQFVKQTRKLNNITTDEYDYESTSELLTEIKPNNATLDLPDKNTTQTVRPSFFIIGVMKCGTSAVTRFLRSHPDLQPCGETYFFSRYYHKGLGWYMSIMPRVGPKHQQLYESTPTYYSTQIVAERIHDMNSTVKIIYVVCDNARRTLSRYFHLASRYIDGKTDNTLFTRLQDVGENLELFNERLNQTIDELGALFQTIKDDLEDPSSMKELVSALLNRYQTRQRPFRIDFGDLKYSFREAILADGLYTVYLTHYLQYFKPEQILTIDGSALMTEPAKIMSKLQKFLDVEEYIKEDNFVYDEERGMYCLHLSDGMDGDEARCLPDTKGRTTDRHLDPVVNAKLHQFFAPFDEYLAQQVRHEKFDWNY